MVGGSAVGLLSIVQQLKNAGFKDPVNTKAKFDDALKDLVSILNYIAKQPVTSNIYFEKTTNWLIDGQSMGYKILLNMNNIKKCIRACICNRSRNKSFNITLL